MRFIKSCKKPTAMFLALLLVFGTMFGNVQFKTVKAAEGVTIAGWETPPVGVAVIVADMNTITNINATATLSHTSYDGVVTGSSISAKNYGYANWTEGGYYQLQLSTKGYENINLAFSMAGSGSGPSTFEILYSINGDTYQRATEDDILLTVDGSSKYTSFSRSLSGLISNADNLYIRIKKCGDLSISGKAIGSTGSNYIKSISFTGSAITASEITTEPTLPATITEPAAPITITPGVTVIPTMPKVTITPIQTAKSAMTGTSMTVRGMVTFIDGRNVYIEDETAGIDLYFNKDKQLGIAVGDVITVSGAYEVFKGLSELTGVNEYIKQTAPLTEATVEQILANTNGYQARRVFINGAILGETDSKGYTSLTQNGSTINIYKMPAISATSGSMVTVTAIVGYFNAVQLRVVAATDVTVVTEPVVNGTVSAPVSATSSIQNAKTAASGTGLKVTGMVTFIDGKNVYIEDDTAGIVLYFKSAPANLVIGDVITASGDYTTYKGLIELNNVETYTKRTLPVTELTLAELLAAGTKYQSMRVLIKGGVLGTINTSQNTTLTQSGSSVNIYKIPALTDIATGDAVNLYAVVGCYNSLQLRVASVADVTKVATVPTVAPTVTVAPPAATDPITDAMVPAGALTIDQMSTVTGGTVTVVGQITYKFGNYNTVNSSILQDVIGGEIVGFQVYNAPSTYQIGDIVAVKGVVSTYGGVKQITAASVTVISSGVDIIPAQNVTISELNTNIEKYLSEYVSISKVKLDKYNEKGSTTITDESSQTIPIYRAATYPAGITEGTVVTVYGVASKFNDTKQLRIGTSESYVIPSVDKIDTSIVLPIASWAGNGVIDKTSVYADLNANNDQLDTSAVLTARLAATEVMVIPQKVNVNNGISSYYLATEGMKDGGYYQFELSSKLYGALSLSFLSKGSESGAKNFIISYSADGVNYYNNATVQTTCNYTLYSKDSTGASVTTPVSSDVTKTDGSYSFVVGGSYHTITATFPAAANKADKLYIRLTVASDIRIKASGSTTSIGNTGTNYLNSIVLSGSPVVSDSICGLVSINPAAGNAMIGQGLIMTCATAGATINYSLDNGQTYQVYDKTNIPALSVLPATIKAYAEKTGLTTGIVMKYDYTQAKTATVKATPNGGAVNLGSTVKLTCLTEGAQMMYSTDNQVTWINYTKALTLDALPATLYMKAVKAGYLDSEISSVTFTKRENAKYNVYFGQIHSHTSVSDGIGTVDQALSYAKNEAEQLDFLAITDHSNLFDNDITATIKDGSSSTEWVSSKTLAASYTDSTFVALIGYEMTWSGGSPGHMNTFNTAGFLSRNMEGLKNGDTSALTNYYAALKTSPNSISMFNHPGSTFGDFDDFGSYDAEIDTAINLIEVGNGEGDVGSSKYFASYEYYTRALDKGWHIAPTNNQDNHEGQWGDGNTARTVILADTLTEDSVYEAMSNMRVYATEDNDLSMWYELNGAEMGTILEDKPSEVDIDVELADPDNEASKVEVIVQGGVAIDSETITSGNGKVDFTFAPNYAYYYIRVTQADGDIAVSAPVWIDEVEAVGVASVTTTAKLPIKGEAIDITTNLYNNETSDLTINSMVFSVDGQVINTVDAAKSGFNKVTAGKTQSFTFNYTHGKIGSTEVLVTVNAEFEGAPKVYQGTLKLTYVDDSLVAKVIVDGTNANDYVTGYYGGNLGNFSGIAASEYVQVNVVTSAITKEILADCDLLVISAPAKKAGTYNGAPYVVSHFTDSYIALVKEYVDNGGDIIVCGLADYQDSATSQSSTEINKLLAAIGATTKLNSDEAIDDVKNGGSNYRLYVNTFNTASPFLKGVDPAQTYSAYSGCTVLLDDAAVKSGAATWLVKGHATTYSIDSKTYDSNYKAIDKGNAVLLAQETLSSGSNVFVAGTVFVSNFEVAVELDNATSLPYANKTIVQNILDMVKVEMPVSTIAQMRAGEQDEIFAIEGYVTAGTAISGNSFFDVIYVQDATGGTTVFPFAVAGVAIGTKVRILGFVDSYQGDKELQVISYEILSDADKNIIAPAQVTTKEAADYAANGGKLMKISGKVTKIVQGSAGIQSFFLKDDSGVEARVYMDGYILASGGTDDTASIIKLGNTISAVGIGYLNSDGSCLRVRDRSEILLVAQGTEPTVTPVPAVTTTPTAVPSTQDTQGTVVTTSPSPTVTPTVTPGLEDVIDDEIPEGPVDDATDIEDTDGNEDSDSDEDVVIIDIGEDEVPTDSVATDDELPQTGAPQMGYYLIGFGMMMAGVIILTSMKNKGAKV